jgi:two-component sensor histidine kinase
VHAPSQLLLDRFELRPHSIVPGFPHDEELAPTVALTDEGDGRFLRAPFRRSGVVNYASCSSLKALKGADRMLQRLRTFAQMTTYLGMAMIVIIWGAVFYFGHVEQEEASEAAVREGANLARIFEEYICRVVGGADAMLLALRELYRQDPQHFDIGRLTGNEQSQDRIVQFAIVSSDGAVLDATKSMPPGKLDDREYFRFQARSESDELYISAPLIGYASGRPKFVLTRRLMTSDGAFGGVVIAAIDILRLEEFYRLINIGPEGAIALIGFDGIIRVRSGPNPQVHDFVGKSAAQTRLFSLYRQSPSGRYWNFENVELSLDRIRRLIFYRVVQGFPLIVTVGLGESDIFKEATSVQHKYYLVALVLSACVIGPIGIAARRQDRLSSTMAALEQAVAELDHRVKNTLARIAAVVQYTRQGSRSMDELVHALDHRIQSMADTHALLSRSHWHGVSLAELVRGQLAPYTTSTNTAIDGPDIALSAGATQALGMVLHELVTNAVKYGALSNPRGKVSVSWDHRPSQDAGECLAIVWRETGGPPLASPNSSKYGTNLIRGLIPRELGGAVDLAFQPEGVLCNIEIPVRGVNAN